MAPHYLVTFPFIIEDDLRTIMLMEAILYVDGLPYLQCSAAANFTKIARLDRNIQERKS